MIEYEHMKHALSEYLEGELLLSERQTVERHLKVCAVCRQELRTLRRTVDALQRLPHETTPTDFMDKLKMRIARHEVKSQYVPDRAPEPPAALARWVLDPGRILFFSLLTRIPLYIQTAHVAPIVEYARNDEFT
jgi:anti-sigma factor RsiW